MVAKPVRARHPHSVKVSQPCPVEQDELWPGAGLWAAAGLVWFLALTIS
jgi:hypothetical protein